MHTTAAIDQHNQGFRLHLASRLAEAEPFYRRAVTLDPDFPEAWMNLGLAVLGQRRPDEALACQREAVRLVPENACAQNNLGMAHYAQGHIAEAENCFRAALRLAPGHANATLNLGSARQIQNDIQQAEALFRHALTLGADRSRANSNLALAMMEQGRPAEAERLCREALALNPSHHEARANLALALLTQGRLTEGWAEYESRWAVEAMGLPVQTLPGPGLPGPGLPVPRWTGQALNGETILLWAEQGFGDTLQFCRYVPMVAKAGGRVVLAVPAALRRLMQTLDGVSVLLTEDDDLPPFNYHCPLLSLPYAFATTLETIPATVPYLHAEPLRTRSVPAGPSPVRRHCEEQSGEAISRPGGMVGVSPPAVSRTDATLAAIPAPDRPLLSIGLVWAGRSRTEQPHAVAIDKRRSVRLADLAPLLTVPGCAFVSLQLGPPAAQLAAFPAVRDISPALTDWSGTAAVIANLDLVIAVDTAVAHLAGALGKPVWLLSRFDACWRWFRDRDDTPWYPTMRLFRQPSRGDWGTVIAYVRDSLLALSDARNGGATAG
jgi:Flp pilus assembly protein TadD